MSGLSAAEIKASLRLIRSENVGPVTYRQLLARYKSATEALAALPDLAKRGGKKALRVCSAGDAEAELEAIAKAGAQLVILGDGRYPVALASLDDSPPVLITRGHAHLLQKPCVGMVGARNASAIGRKLATEIAADLGKAGYVVVSGLARGIDGAAHQGALATGTIGVAAGGIDIIYPPEHGQLYAEIGENGLLVSEMPLGTKPQARHFPRRNRIISGLSLGTLVVEAAPRSGSLITARNALEQGREVFAVPGSPLDPRYRGTNGLIRQGAVLTESAKDIIDGLQAQSQQFDEPGKIFFDGTSSDAENPAELASAREKLEELLGFTPIAIDELIRQSNLTPATVLTILLELELAGRLERQPGQKVLRCE